MRLLKAGRLAWVFAMLGIAGAAGANELDLRLPDALYLQAGLGKNVASASVGLTWDFAWTHENALGSWDAYLDLSLGHWRISNQGATPGHQDATRVGLTPVLRLQPRGWGRFFVEAGIGLNWVFPIYQNDNRKFSTTFNFGDHLAAGWRFGPSGDQEVILSIQHYSNAGIKDPNPGENFVQLRYSQRF